MTRRVGLRRRWVPAAVVALAMLLAASCSSSSPAEPTASAPTTSNPPVYPPPAAKSTADPDAFCAEMLAPLRIGPFDVLAADPPLVDPDTVPSAVSGEGRVFLDPAATKQQIAAVGERMSTELSEVDVEFIDQAAAFAEFEALFADEPEIRAGIGQDDMSTSYRFTWREADLAGIAAAIAGIERMDGVFDVAAPQEWMVGPAPLDDTTLYELLVIGPLLPVLSLYLPVEGTDADAQALAADLTDRGFVPTVVAAADGAADLVPTRHVAVIRVESPQPRSIEAVLTDLVEPGVLDGYTFLAPTPGVGTVVVRLTDALFALPATQAAAARARAVASGVSPAELDLLQGFATGRAVDPGNGIVHEIASQLRDFVESTCDGPCACTQNEALWRLADSIADARLG